MRLQPTAPISLHMPSWYPSRVSPTLGNFIQKHIECALLLGGEAWVIYPELDSKIPLGKFEVAETIESKVKVIRVYYNVRFKKWGLLRAYLMGLRHFKESGIKPTVVHLHVLQKASIFAWTYSMLNSLPLVYSEHWTGFLPANLQFKKSSLKGVLLRRVARSARFIMPVTKHLQVAMAQAGITGNFNIIPNVVDTGIFKLKKKAEGRDQVRRLPQFIHISHLQEPHKNFKGLLEGFKIIKGKNIEFELHIVTDGDYERAQSLIAQFEFSSTEVKLNSSMLTAEIAAMLAASDCLVMFSRFENFPCVIAEAMATGIPVISTTVGGIAEHVSALNGLLIANENVNELALALEKVAKGFVQFDQEQISSYTQAHFIYQKVGCAINCVYSNL